MIDIGVVLPEAFNQLFSCVVLFIGFPFAFLGIYLSNVSNVFIIPKTKPQFSFTGSFLPIDDGKNLGTSCVMHLFLHMQHIWVRKHTRTPTMHITLFCKLLETIFINLTKYTTQKKTQQNKNKIKAKAIHERKNHTKDKITKKERNTDRQF